jgi:hypothetical protein
MWRRFPILGLVWLAAVRGGAEEPAGAPLEGTKQELKKLQTDQATRNSSAATGGLTDGMPQIETPVPGVVPLEMPAADKAEKDRKKKAEARKNWLLDGVDKLGKSNGNQGREAPATGEAVPDDGTDQPDSSDPDYILKVYTQQKKAAEAKADQQKSTAARGDPFAPFLQGWLETSPARGKFFDEFVRKPDAPGGIPATTPSATEHGFNPGSVGGDMADSTRSVPMGAQSNPYLQGLGSPPLPDSRVGSSLPTAISNALAGPAPRQSAAGTIEPIPASRPAEKKPPLLAPSDDKIYFPQLKKF